MISNKIKFDPDHVSPMLFELATTDKILVVPNEAVRQDMIHLWRVSPERVEVQG
jgi:hypothetical protein